MAPNSHALDSKPKAQMQKELHLHHKLPCAACCCSHQHRLAAAYLPSHLKPCTHNQVAASTRSSRYMPYAATSISAVLPVLLRPVLNIRLS